MAAVEASSATAAHGELFLYNEDWGMGAFEFGADRGSRRALVCVGGLTDGLLSMRYLPRLAGAVGEDGWRVVQPVLSSSYSGWGTASLDSDVADLDRLLGHLAERRGVAEVVLLGHSTGCQDAVRYLATGSHVSMVRGAILQAPVSDREALPLTSVGSREEFDASLGELRDIARKMIREGKGQEAMPRRAADLIGPPHAVTAYRFDSLTGRMTDDDMFSSDLSDEELRAKLGHVAVPTLLAMSLDDEYVPRSVDPAALSKRMSGAMAAGVLGLVWRLHIDKAGHALRSEGSAQAFVEGVRAFVGRLEAPGRPRISWEAQVATEIRRRAEGFSATGASADGARARSPLMVALVGIPGAGKTTSARILERLLGPSCLVVPADGFHLPMADLRQRPDADDAVYRRGAPDTFDPVALRAKLSAISLRSASPSAEVLEEVTLPSFEHSVGDPVDHGVTFRRSQHEVVIVEGLYLLHDDHSWEGLCDLFDYRVYLDADIDECIAGLKERNKAIPGYTPDEIEVRCERVDRSNATIVQKSSSRADMSVRSERSIDSPQAANA